MTVPKTFYQENRCFPRDESDRMYQTLFTDFVYRRVHRRNPHLSVVHGGIWLKAYQEGRDAPLLSIRPTWRMLEEDPVREARKEIEGCADFIRQTDSQLVYLVYPATARFRRHIPLHLSELGEKAEEHRVKLIPYFCTATDLSRFASLI